MTEAAAATATTNNNNNNNDATAHLSAPYVVRASSSVRLRRKTNTTHRASSEQKWIVRFQAERKSGAPAHALDMHCAVLGAMSKLSAPNSNTNPTAVSLRTTTTTTTTTKP